MGGEWADGWMDRWIDGDRWMDGWGWMDILIYNSKTVSAAVLVKFR